MILRDEARCVGDSDLVRKQFLISCHVKVSQSDFLKADIKQNGDNYSLDGCRYRVCMLCTDCLYFS